MDNLKKNISENIIMLRQAAGVTQAGLAERLNYSDKAVSKWERCESLPDITVLKQIADMFGVTVDYLLQKHGAEMPVHLENEKARKKNHLIITLLSTIIIWFIATLVFVVAGLALGSFRKLWVAFVWAVPISSIIFIVFNSIWGSKKLNYLFISLLIWSFLASIYLTLLCFVGNYPLIFVIGIPGQIAVILWSRIRKPKKHAQDE